MSRGFNLLLQLRDELELYETELRDSKAREVAALRNTARTTKAELIIDNRILQQLQEPLRTKGA